MLLIGQYGVKQVVGALSGRPELGALAGDVLGAVAASESGLGSRLAGIEDRLAGIERRLDQVLAQRYEIEVGSGLRCLLDAAGSSGKRARNQDLKQARQHFRNAAAAAASALQRALAERYLLLCALTLNRHDAAKTAFAQLNAAMTAAAFEVSDGLREASSAAPQRGGQSGFTWRNQRRELQDRQEGELKHIHQGASDAAKVIQALFAEAGALGQAFGRPAPTPIRPIVSQTSITWQVGVSHPDPIGLGALTATWQQFDLQPVRPYTPRWEDLSPLTARSLAAAEGRPEWQLVRRSQYVMDAEVVLVVEADPVLARDIVVRVYGPRLSMASRDFRFLPVHYQQPSADPDLPTLVAALPAGTRSCRAAGMLTLSSDRHGALLTPVRVEIGDFTILRV
ncbi:hypothetical protein [Nonomuraea basaltis]|uniref:hypothetical protein n=1 Tax=Nonomuraea basaltis TaxID=2495887 RepID=UPI00110C50E9|nr:hypothetical protein [Nonomuraea basaltis]TMR90878.1 hypothetical protein EJK15_52880 [Nonomuraea basaltis]